MEQVVRDDYTSEAMELLEMYCTLVHTRFGLLDHSKECDPSIREAVATIIYATPSLQSQIAELATVCLHCPHDIIVAPVPMPMPIPSLCSSRVMPSDALCMGSDAAILCCSVWETFRGGGDE